jgi:hypothetical protein
MDLILSFVICNDSHKNKNGGQQVKYNKMKFEKMEDQTKILYFNLLQK